MKELKELEGKLIKAIEELDEEAVMKLSKEALDAGLEPPYLLEVIAQGMTKVGELYQSQDYFIADLIMSGIIFKDVLKLEPMKAHFLSNTTEKMGKMLLGTVRGDIHDIGKDIFKGMLEANGFEVIDLGVDVPKEIFLSKYQEYQPDIVGLSGILTSTIETMKDTVDAFVQSGDRGKVKLIIGGSHLTEEACRYIGADNYANDVSRGVKVCREWMGIRDREDVTDDE